MALSIISNQAASIATRSLGQSNDAATATAEKLSSGKRINSAADDAAGSAIAARLSAEVAGLQQAGVNAGQASSLLQIADGAFQNVEDILTRAKSLSVQAGSDQISDQERAFLDQEFQALKGEIDRIAGDTEFNGTNLVNGALGVAGGDGAGGSGLTMLQTVDDGTVAASLNTAATGANGVQGLAAMGVNLASATGSALNVVNTMNSEIGAATTIPAANQGAVLTGVAGSLNVDTQAGNTVMGSLTQMFTLNVAVMTTGGATTGGVFQGTIGTMDAGVGAAGSTTLSITMDVGVVLKATADNISGSFSINIGTNFDPATANAAASLTMGPNVYINGEENKEFTFKVGTGTNAAEDEISVNIGGITTTALGIDNSTIDSKAAADAASDSVSRAIDALQAKRSDVGAAQNRLDFAGQNVELTRENQEAARSELEDLNVAKAITEFSQQQLLVQAGTSTLSQANSLPQNLLQLFR